MNQCHGHCCKIFYLPYSPEELKANYDAFQKNESDQIISYQIEKIWPMLIYHGRFNKNQLIKYCKSKNLIPPITDKSHSGPENYYTCKNHLPNNLCGIYEDRPDMCRSYPNKGPCEYPGCNHPKVDNSNIKKKDKHSNNP